VTIEPYRQPLPSMRAASGAALVRVRDNGGGFASDSGSGFGLIGMRERVMALGGSVTVASTERGVIVEAIVPNGVKS
jgi:two-component system sensor histidine kinase UhpB